MCTDYPRRKAIKAYERSFSQLKLPLVFPDPSRIPNLMPQDDVRPRDTAPIFRSNGGGVELVMAQWWLTPFWHRGALKDWKLPTFNARAETVATAKTFKEPFAKRRAIIPADGWYEWTGPKGDKQRWLFGRKDGEDLYFAGLWDRCQTSDQGEVTSFTIITQPAGSPLNGYHDRAPVVLEQAQLRRWLDLEANVVDLLGPESTDLFNVEKAEPLRLSPKLI